MKVGKKAKWIVAGAVLVVLIAVSMFSGGGAQVLTAQVERGEVFAYVEDRAKTSLPDVVHLTMPQPGRVLPIDLQEGDRVSKGQVVIRLDNADLLDALKESNDMVEAMANAVKAGEAQVKASRTRAEYLKWLWEALDKIYRRQAISEKTAKEARAAFLQAEMDMESDTATTYAWKAMASLTRLFPIYVKRNLKRATVTSPIDGVVLKRFVKDEVVLQPGEPILDIGNLSELQVTVEVLTEEASQIASGDRVEIFGETLGSETLKGKVVRVKPSGFTKLSSLGVEQQRVEVIVAFAPGELERLHQAGRSLGTGFRVRARIYTDSARNVLVVPRTALFGGAGESWQVYAVKNGRARLTDVVPGLGNEEKVAVLQGLAEGDEVILAPDSSLVDGAKVTAHRGGAK